MTQGLQLKLQTMSYSFMLLKAQAKTGHSIKLLYMAFKYLKRKRYIFFLLLLSILYTEESHVSMGELGAPHNRI